MTDMPEIAPVLTGTFMSAFADWSVRALAKLKSLPFWADTIIVGAGFVVLLAATGVFSFAPPRDTRIETGIAGIAASLNDLSAKLTKIESRDAICPAGITTGTITNTKPKR